MDRRLIRFEGYELDPATRSLRYNSAPVALAPKTFDLLLYLAEHPQQLVSKEELLSAIWPDSFVEESNLSQHLFLLRKALATAGKPERLVVTVPGRGYQFTATVDRVALNAANPAQNLELSAVQSVQTVTRIVVEEEVDDGEDLPLTAQPRLPAPRRHWSRWALPATAATLLLLGAASFFLWRETRPSAQDHVQVVIADFENSTGDPTFDHTLNKVVQIDLLQSPYFSLVGEGRVRRALTSMGRKAGSAPGGLISSADVREVCQRLNAQLYLTPAIAKLGDRYLITMAANACSDGHLVGDRKEDTDSKSGVLRAVEQVTSHIRRDVGESRASLKQFDKPIYLEPTSSLEALTIYSEGTRAFNAGRMEDAAQLFHHATELDPNFAMAYEDLSSCYFNLGDHRQDMENISKAYAMRDTVDGRDRFAILNRYHQSVTGDLHAQEETLRLWAATYPRDTVALANLANALGWSGKFQDSADVASRMVAMNEADGVYNGVGIEIAARAFRHLGQDDKALEYYGSAVKRGVDSAGIHSLALEIAASRGDQAEVERQIAWSRNKPDESHILQYAAMAAMADGRVRASDVLFAQATAAAKRDQLEPGLAPLDAYRIRMLVEMGAVDHAQALLKAFHAPDDGLDATYARAEIGDIPAAKAAAAAFLKEYPQDTLANLECVPAVNAALAMRAGKPQDALQLLEADRPFELHDPTTIYGRAKAYLAAAKYAEAAAEFQKLIDRPGLDDPPAPLYALSFLGRARALRLENKRDEAKAAYTQFLTLWKSADADTPELAKARSELQHL